MSKEELSLHTPSMLCASSKMMTALSHLHVWVWVWVWVCVGGGGFDYLAAECPACERLTLTQLLLLLLCTTP